MKLSDCEKEIIDRQYLIGMELEHHTGTHKIMIDVLEPYPISNMDIYYIRCRYFRQDENGAYSKIPLTNKLNDILSQYLPY